MLDRSLSRRSFLAVTGGLLVATSCGTGSSKDSSKTSTTMPMRDTKSGDGSGKLSALLLSSDLYATEQPQRLVFGLASGTTFAAGSPAKIAVQPPGGTLGPFVDTTLHTEGLPKGRGIYVAELPLDTVGDWPARVMVRDQEVDLAFSVQGGPTAPAAGMPAPTAASPTTVNALGVDPICTRDPDCPLHTVSLDTVIGKGKPVAVLFATPARCQSQYCGPVLDSLLPLVPRYQDTITFVHVEIYQDTTSEDLVATVEAWNLASEPWLFGVDSSGKIVSRLDGAFAGDEMDALLGKLAGA